MTLGGRARAIGAVVLGAAVVAAAVMFLPWASAGFLTVVVSWLTYAALRGVTGGRPLVFRRRGTGRGTGFVGDVAGFGEQLWGNGRRYGYGTTSG